MDQRRCIESHHHRRGLPLRHTPARRRARQPRLRPRCTPCHRAKAAVGDSQRARLARLTRDVLCVARRRDVDARANRHVEGIALRRGLRTGDGDDHIRGRRHHSHRLLPHTIHKSRRRVAVADGSSVPCGGLCDRAGHSRQREAVYIQRGDGKCKACTLPLRTRDRTQREAGRVIVTHCDVTGHGRISQR